MRASPQDLLSGQAGLAGVRHLLYGRQVRDRLRRELATLLDPGATLGSCRLERAKFKPGRKLTGYYVVDVVGARGRVARGVEVVWSIGDGAAARPPLAAELAMEDEARAAGVAAPFRALRADVPGFGVRVSPMDATFPQLVRLSTPDRVRELLATTYARTGAGQVAPAYAIGTVRYRPRQRHVLRYDPIGSSGASVFAKLYRPGGAARAVQVTNAVADRVERAGPGIGAVRPLDAPPDQDAAVYPRVSGSPLSRHLWDPGPAPARRLARAGALLRALHDDTDDPGVDLAHEDLGGQIAVTARAADHLGPLVPDAAALVSRILDRARELDARSPAEESCFAHGDFKADHIWVARDELTLLDFDTCCIAEPALDVGKFLADLSWWYAASGRPGVAEAQAGFLHGYGSMPAGRLARARLYEAVVLTRITIRRLRRFEPDWDQRTRDLLARAARVMDAAAPATSREPATAARP